MVAVNILHLAELLRIPKIMSRKVLQLWTHFCFLFTDRYSLLLLLLYIVFCCQNECFYFVIFVCEFNVPCTALSQHVFSLVFCRFEGGWSQQYCTIYVCILFTFLNKLRFTVFMTWIKNIGFRKNVQKLINRCLTLK